MSMDKESLGFQLLFGKEYGKVKDYGQEDEKALYVRQSEIIRLCNVLANGQIMDVFPGMQPTSLTRQKIDDNLLCEPYVVCEKTDGERHLLLAYEAKVYLIDRRSRVWVAPIQLPLREDHPRYPGWHHKTLLDGELVADAIADGKGDKEWRYLIYDAIAISGEDMTHRTLLYRLRRTIEDVVIPKERLTMYRDTREPFHVMLKDFFEIWQMKEVMNLCENLPHKSDGLIFTPVMVPYVPGSCPALLKWKPSSLNTVDFKLQVVRGTGRQMHVSLLVGMKKKEEWHVKASGLWLAKLGDMFRQLQKDPEKFQGKICECRWSQTAKTFTPIDANRFTLDGTWSDGGWVLQRLREDKTQPNDMRTAKRVVESIEDDLSFEDLNKKIQAAHSDGSLKCAALCGEGELQRAPETKPLVSWARPADSDERTEDHSRHDKRKGKGKGRGKDKDKGKDGRDGSQQPDGSGEAPEAAGPPSPPAPLPPPPASPSQELASAPPQKPTTAVAAAASDSEGRSDQERGSFRAWGRDSKKTGAAAQEAAKKAAIVNAELVRWSKAVVGDSAASADEDVVPLADMQSAPSSAAVHRRAEQALEHHPQGGLDPSLPGRRTRARGRGRGRGRTPATADMVRRGRMAARMAIDAAADGEIEVNFPGGEEQAGPGAAAAEDAVPRPAFEVDAASAAVEQSTAPAAKRRRPAKADAEDAAPKAPRKKESAAADEDVTPKPQEMSPATPRKRRVAKLPGVQASLLERLERMRAAAAELREGPRLHLGLLKRRRGEHIEPCPPHRQGSTA